MFFAVHDKEISAKARKARKPGSKPHPKISIDKTDFHTSATKVEVIRVDTATLILNSKLAALINECIEHPQVTSVEIPFNYINLTIPESKGYQNHIFLGQSKRHFLFWWGSLGCSCLLCVLNVQQWRMHRLARSMYTEKAVGLLLSAPTQSRSLQWSLSTGHSTTSTGCRQPSSRQWRQLRGPAPFTGRSLSTESCCQLGTGASSPMRSPGPH